MQQYVKIILALGLIVLSFNGYSFSSYACLKDSLKEDKEKNAKFYFALDARRSFVLDSRKTKFTGFKLGVSIKEKYRIGLGFYNMKNPIRLPGLSVDKNEYPDASDTVLFNFNYTSFFYQPIWFTSKRWEISTPFQLGIGTIKLFYRDTTDTQNIEFLRGGVPLATGSAVFQYKVLRWFAFGVGFGYRASLTSDRDVKNAVNAPFYAIQAKVLLGELYRMVFKRKELEEW